MIFHTPSLTLPLSLKADLCIIGSGAGGSMVANIAAKAGMKVIVLEAGPFVTPSDMTQREEEMLSKLFWESGARTTADRAVHIHQGRGIGGSTLHNLNLCTRIPDPIIDHWIESRKLGHLGHQDWDKLYKEVEKMLEVSDVPENMINKHNRILENACKKLGWEGGCMKHNRTGCVGSGFCELGCSYDAKSNACKILVREAVKAGTEFFSH